MVCSPLHPIMKSSTFPPAHLVFPAHVFRIYIPHPLLSTISWLPGCLIPVHYSLLSALSLTIRSSKNSKKVTLIRLANYQLQIYLSLVPYRENLESTIQKSRLRLSHMRAIILQTSLTFPRQDGKWKFLRQNPTP
jgi:hypothetical protein